MDIAGGEGTGRGDNPVRPEPLTDDLGHPLVLRRPPRRIVSLVPSLTEALAVTVPDRLVGATNWCTHPAGLDVPRVRGTKNPDRAAVASLAPDLVVANQEENRRIDVERLRAAGIPVWVTVIESLDDAVRSLRRLFTDVLEVTAPTWLTVAAQEWGRPPPCPQLRVAVPVWRDPWMVVGSRTFAGSLLARLGLVNVFGGALERYPHVGIEELRSAGADVVLLPDEPYAFSSTDGPEVFSDGACLLVSGRDLTWYGPSLVTARAELLRQIRGSSRPEPIRAGAQRPR